MLRMVLLVLAAILLMSGCGSGNLVGPPAPEAPTPSQIHAVGDADGGSLVPPVKAENYLAPEPDNVELGPRG